MRVIVNVISFSSIFLLLLPSVNFINVLRAAFTHADPESAKKTVKSSSFFALLGSARVKAARRMLMKLNPSLLGKYGASRSVTATGFLKHFLLYFSRRRV